MTPAPPAGTAATQVRPPRTPARPTLRDDVVALPVPGGVVLAVDDVPGSHLLDHRAAAVVGRLDGSADVRQVAEQVAALHRAPLQRVLPDVVALTRWLHGCGLLVGGSGPREPGHGWVLPDTPCRRGFDMLPGWLPARTLRVAGYDLEVRTDDARADALLAARLGGSPAAAAGAHLSLRSHRTAPRLRGARPTATLTVGCTAVAGADDPANLVATVVAWVQAAAASTGPGRVAVDGFAVVHRGRAIVLPRLPSELALRRRATAAGLVLPPGHVAVLDVAAGRVVHDGGSWPLHAWLVDDAVAGSPGLVVADALTRLRPRLRCHEPLLPELTALLQRTPVAALPASTADLLARLVGG